jgi:hypothetical protein
MDDQPPRRRRKGMRGDERRCENETPTKEMNDEN